MGRACQNDHDAFAGGVTAHDSCAGVGSPSIRQRNASPYCVVPAVVKPAACIASNAFAALPGAQPRSICPPGKWVKSTITMTPDVAGHAGDAAAPRPAVGAPTAMIAIAAPAATVHSRRVRPFTASSSLRQHGVRGRIVDAADFATGRVLDAIAGTDCTVANALPVMVGGKKNAPLSAFVHPSW